MEDTEEIEELEFSSGIHAVPHSALAATPGGMGNNPTANHNAMNNSHIHFISCNDFEDEGGRPSNKRRRTGQQPQQPQHQPNMNFRYTTSPPLLSQPKTTPHNTHNTLTHPPLLS